MQTIRDIIDWGLVHAMTRPDEASFIRELGCRLAASGLAVERLSLALIPMFADVDGTHYIWDRARPDEVSMIQRNTGFLSSPEHLQSPLHNVWENRQPLRVRLSRPEEAGRFPFLVELAARGYTDYLAWPLDQGEHSRQQLTLVTRAADGFPPGLIEELRGLLALVALVVDSAETRRLSMLAGRDALTGLANRRAFELYLRQAWSTCHRGNLALSLLLFDLDCFKSINDTHGHGAGDLCLQQIALSTKQALRRDGDLAARLGGDEFAVVLPGTPAAGAVRVAEKVRERILHAPWPVIFGVSEATVTVSIGAGSVVPSASDGIERLRSEVDKVLYVAKSGGRNRVASAGDLAERDAEQPPSA